MAAVKGMRELQAKLRRLETHISSDTLAEAAMAGAFVQQNRIQEIIREKNIVDTGQLLGSVAAHLDEVGGSRAQTSTGTSVEHGPPNEFGTWKMAARPFMRPGFDESQDDAVAAVRARLARALTDVT